MNTPVNPAVFAAENATTKEKIRAFLVSELAEWSIDPDNVYINGVNDPEERMVIGSNSLTAEAINRVFEKDAPSYSTRTAGLFTVAYSYADEHRLAAPDLAKVGEVIGQLVNDLG
ncbi:MULTISPECIES: hypothetical protein [Pseudomonas syringae group]|uniref:Uncharacterized protein n=2 Tax=Pseudomonas syringae group TaxID=136849 RepID=A0A0Q0AKZ4_PSESX|nr:MULTISPECIES: hypothetical protein [Pseudomonas syringae group]KPC07124.1 Uncharacterized protein AC500_1285 [Pseudomonas amygdali pv. lachrymans]PYD04163.1 hypothetical protein DND90_06980 [Pseudomonas syringae pv. maculicola]EGH98113.1 hypothetical protein PLA106_18624 [Pseudomonas amygdali pv. lachrymans str. M302278]KPY78116.1 Uncharacterized protein ALO94_04390 [Pseudomonas syringae pv. spinaceae]KTC05486.1 hypothetical protein AO386_02655 [Pseudomonas syringae ICMP 11292]